MASRHRCRELAVQMAYQWALNPKSLQDSLGLERFWAENSADSDENKDFFETLVSGVAERMPELDALIEKYLKKEWRLDRLEKVELSLLRVALFELLFYKGKDPADAAVVINEAVEIAKKFGTPQAASFVNALLDTARKELKSA